jgi:hypothetical protein
MHTDFMTIQLFSTKYLFIYFCLSFFIIYFSLSETDFTLSLCLLCVICQAVEIQLQSKAQEVRVQSAKMVELRELLGSKDLALHDITNNIETISLEVNSANHRAETLQRGGT